MTRFRESVLGVDEGSVCNVKLSFYMDAQRRRIVSGELEALVSLECQRCMGDMRTTLNSQFTLGLVTSDEQAQQLPKDLEPFLTDDFSAELWSMVEDELLLVLPAFPLHERSECPAREDLEAYEPDGSPAQPDEPKKRIPSACWRISRKRNTKQVLALIRGLRFTLNTRFIYVNRSGA